MNNKQTTRLNKEVIRISAIFALSIFTIVLLLEVFLLWYKYYDYVNQEMQRLTIQAENFWRVVSINPEFEDLISDWNDNWIFKNRPQWMMWLKLWPNNSNWPKRIRLENFFIFNNKWEILFSPIRDDDFYKWILEQINKSWNNEKFSYNWIEYFYILKPVNNSFWAVFFVESRFTLMDSIKEFGEYFIFSVLLALLIYYISYKFVYRSLKPVEENIADMEQFIHNAWHELKTPISVIKSHLELSELKNDYKEWVKESIIELDKMNDLIQVLINLSTINNTVNVAEVNWEEIINESIKTFSREIEEKNIKIKINKKSDLIINCNKEYFKIFFNNILKNAIKYNKQTWKIDIIIDKKSLEITDSWVWINKENVAKIFDRFYQESESREVNSFWIWLTLVKKIADIYWWKITVESQKWIGTTFRINF